MTLLSLAFNHVLPQPPSVRPYRPEPPRALWLYTLSAVTPHVQPRRTGSPLDEIEGTLRGHIGLIEDVLDRIEVKANAKKQEELYGKRGRDEKK